MKLAKGTKLFVNGYPKSFGYSLNGDIEYNIQDAKLPLFKLKEWDFYQIVNRKFSLYFIIGHVSYATSINVTLFEFDTNKSFYIGKLLPFKKVKLENNANCNSNVIYKDKDYYLSFRKDGKNRFIEFMANGKGEASVRLNETLDDNVLVATPFNKKKQFYYNQKNCLMKANGFVKFGDEKYDLEDSYGLLDFGRGVLPFKHNWVWGNGSGIVNGKPFGFNIGKFGNNEFGSENIFFYDGKGYKLNQVNITFSEDAFMDEWEYLSDDGSFVFKMKPVYDNHTKTKVLWVNNECHQVFGYFNGYIKIGEEKIEIKDFWAFTEFAHNRW